MKSLVRCFCLVATASTAPVFANNGLDAYRQGNYEKAAQQLAIESSKDPVVDYYIGRMRLYGYGQLKNNITALHYFEQAAEKGFLPAQYFMGRYELSQANHPEQALYWFKKSAQANDISAQMYCSAAYLFGVGVKKNTELAKPYFIAAAKNGNSIAQYTLAEHFLESRQVANKKLGLIWLTKSVAQNNAAAQAKLGEFYTQGIMVEQDLAKAKELVELSIAQGYVGGIYLMGEIALKNNDLKQASYWFTKAAKADDSRAEMALSQLYFNEKGPSYDPHLGFLWMLKAAQNSYAPAQLALAAMYKEGKVIAKDENLAKEWQHKAAHPSEDRPQLAQEKAAQWLSQGKQRTLAACGYRPQGIFTAWHNLNALKENNYNQAPQMRHVSRETLFKPKFVMTNPNDIAISEYYDAIALSLSKSSHEELSFPRYAVDTSWQKAILASIPADQSAIPSTPGASPAIPSESALSRLQGRASLGDSNAQFTLAQVYQEGIGVDKSITEAIKYYELASAQQDLRAEYNLGMIYLEGQGVPADYTKAVSLLRNTAFKGNEHAQYVLARIDEQGYRNPAGELVIEPDPEQGMAMYSLAAVNHYGLAQYRLAEMLVREKQSDVSVVAKQKRNQMIKELYAGAAAAGVAQAALPLAFFNAMDSDKAKQAQAFEVAKKQANDGNLDAALLLGLLYDRGVGVEADQDEAISWYQKAASNPISAFILGTYHSQGGTPVSEDIEEGKSLLQQAADVGFPYANLNLAVLKQKKGEVFLPELGKALAAGNSKAGLLLADYYLSRANDTEQMKQARDIYQHFAEKGDREGQLKLGYMLDQGLGGEVNIVAAEEWYKKSAEQNQFVAQYFLGKLYQLGRVSGQPDYIEAKKWYSAAQSHYAPAAIALGFIYDTVDDNYQQALKGYEKAAEKQDTIAQFDSGLIYENGKGRPVDCEKARGLYQAAADKNHSGAMVQLAGLYFNGSLGSRDVDLALEWYKKAAGLGDRDGLYHLGLLHETGVATDLDFAEAIRYYEQAAGKGNAKAMLALARMYHYGLGVAQNNQEAQKYYQELAALGNGYAQYQLAMFAYEGINGERSPEQGKKLLLQAQENGSLQASKVLQWLEAQAQQRLSFIEPIPLDVKVTIAEQPAELMYFDALSAWNRGDERSSRVILDQIMMQFPKYEPAKRAYQQLNQQFAPGILG